MEAVIQSFGTELYRDRTHTGYKVLVKHMIPLWKKWSKNRDPDMERVEEMVTSGAYIPKFIHLAELDGEGLVCYDGNHRREVLKQMETGGVAGSVAGGASCIIDVMFNATQDDVYEAFMNINKGVEVPEIYMGDMNNIKDEVISLVKKYESRYKSFVSVSSKCHAPHFNRDVFTENISKIYTYLNGQRTIQEIGLLLEQLNKEYSNGNICKPHTSYKPGAIEKCKKYGLWLFLEREVSPDHVERVMYMKRTATALPAAVPETKRKPD